MRGRRRWGYAIALAAVGLGCGPSVVLPEEDGTTSSDSGTTVGADAATSEANATGGSTTIVPGTSGSESGAVLDDTSAAGSSTGETWLFPPGSSYSWSNCDERTGATGLLIELYWDPPPRACVPSPRIGDDGWIFLGVIDWDGRGGTFAVGPDGPAQGSAGISALLAGTVELTVSGAFVPETIALDLQTEDGQSIVGLADLGTCFNPPEAPCE